MNPLIEVVFGSFPNSTQVMNFLIRFESLKRQLGVGFLGKYQFRHHPLSSSDKHFDRRLIDKDSQGLDLDSFQWQMMHLAKFGMEIRLSRS
jgi:hypothetical protein